MPPAFLVLLALLLWVPIPLASNRLQPMALVMVGVAVLAVATVWSCRQRTTAAWSRLWAVRWPLGLLAAFALLVQLQGLVLPLAVVEVVSPKSASAHMDGEQVLGGQAGAGVAPSVSPSDTRHSAHLALACVVVFACTVVLTRTQQQVRWLAGVLVAGGCLQALLGVSMLASGVRVQVLDFVYTFADVQGTFANRNHMAAYLVMCLAVGVGLMLAGFELGECAGRRCWRARGAAVLRFLLGRGMQLRLLLLVMVVALVLTRSRMGNASFFVGLLGAGLLGVWLWRQMAPVLLALILSLVVVDVVLIGSWVGLDRVVERMDETALLKADRRGEETLEERQVASVLGLQSLRDYPWVGSGAGTFESVFPQYRDGGVVGRYQHAHNDYLEIASDTGVIGLGLLLGVVVCTAVAALRVLRSRRVPLARGMAFASLMSMTAMAVHAGVDFNLQIPALVLSFCVVLALAWVADALPVQMRRGPGYGIERSLP